jgi:hypothetical protein
VNGERERGLNAGDVDDAARPTVRSVSVRETGESWARLVVVVKGRVGESREFMGTEDYDLNS